MPPNMIHCRSCRILLNPDLESDSVEVPGFQPLKELDCMIETPVDGCFVNCPHCAQELKIAAKYQGMRVRCKFCDGQFLFDTTAPRFQDRALYATCGHCTEQLRFAASYSNAVVVCRFCQGKLHIIGP